MRCNFCGLVLRVAGIGLAAAGTAYAQPAATGAAQTVYPNKSIRMIIPYGAGGATDVVSALSPAACQNCSASKW